ncbi:MAG TPA: hypothetical protein ENI23_07690 [bacterium]|nr:hypothetical protein [bacterium]
MANYSIDVINEGKRLFLQGFSIRKIAEQLGIKQHTTVFRWSHKYNWKKEKPSYPVNSLKAQLDECTALVNKIQPKLKDIDILKPSTQDRELLLNYNRLSNLQLKLVRQLTGLKVVEKKPTKSNIFL